MDLRVFQRKVDRPEDDITEVLRKLLATPVPVDRPDMVLIAGLEVYSERERDILDLLKARHLFTRQEVQSMLENSHVTYGWFFVGVNELFGMPSRLDDKSAMRSCAFVVDILEGSTLFFRSIHEPVINLLSAMLKGTEVEVLPECDLTELVLSY